MAKPDPRLLDPAQYRFSVAITTRFAVLDPNDHLNNVAIAAMFEDTRVRLSLALGFRPDRTPGGRRFVVAAVKEALAANPAAGTFVVDSRDWNAVLTALSEEKLGVTQTTL